MLPSIKSLIKGIILVGAFIPAALAAEQLTTHRDALFVSTISAAFPVEPAPSYDLNHSGTMQAQVMGLVCRWVPEPRFYFCVLPYPLPVYTPCGCYGLFSMGQGMVYNW